jgi:hypothetical protein
MSNERQMKLRWCLGEELSEVADFADVASGRRRLADVAAGSCYPNDNRSEGVVILRRRDSAVEIRLRGLPTSDLRAGITNRSGLRIGFL